MNVKPPESLTLDYYREFQTCFDFLNDRLFDKQLPPCLITLQRQPRSKGYYSPRRFKSKTGEFTDEIALNPDLFGVFSSEEVISTLAHEMVHMWHEHYGIKPPKNGYHNKEWATKMLSIGLIPTATGKVGGLMTGFKVTHVIEPGGRFEEVMRDLLDSHHDVVTWFDRYGQMENIKLRMNLPETEAAKKFAGIDETQVKKMVAAEKRDLEEREKRRIMKNNSKLKYTHVCNHNERVNIWGRAGLNIVCGDCKKKFEPADTLAAQ